LLNASSKSVRGIQNDVAVLEEFLDQRWFRLDVSGMDVRFFLRGAMLDAGRGKAPDSRAALSPLLGEPCRLIAPSQVHGASVLETSAENAISVESAMSGSQARNVEADGILFDALEAGKLCVEASLRFADCAPVVVAPSRERIELDGERPWVLMMHSGYKGTVLNIARAGLEKTRARYGASALEGAWAWVGPCVGASNYPRDVEEWTLQGSGDVQRKKRESGWRKGLFRHSRGTEASIGGRGNKRKQHISFRYRHLRADRPVLLVQKRRARTPHVSLGVGKNIKQAPR
jgi:copper oxidase (laccase) domain-containing protein